jgi:hypothetical protein
MSELLPEDIEPEIPRERKEVMKPAVAAARANPGRWAKVTTCGTVGSASTQVSKLRKPGCIQVRAGLEFRRIDTTIYVMYDPSKDEFSQAVIPEDAPGLEDEALASPPPLDPPADLS